MSADVPRETTAAMTATHGPLHLTNMKTKDIAGRGYNIVGYVLRRADGEEVCISAESAVRWLPQAHYWRLMHEQADEVRSEAARDVLAERRRQVEAEGWTPEHDDHHDNGQMAVAAGYYAMASGYPHERDIGHGGIVPTYWPWAPSWWKPSTARRNLIKAGALILAEIERIDRAGLAGDAGEQADAVSRETTLPDSIAQISLDLGGEHGG